ncbi:MAG: AMP-binding protein [Coriobacteriia bacterium]|nr:AMP-binding protein [Coriobacteriia bacterium]
MVALPGNIALVSGGSGFLGAHVLEGLMGCGFTRIYVLVRGEDETAAANRLRRIWHERPVLLEAIGKRIRVVCGDIAKERFGMDGARYDALAAEVTHVVHAAAEIGVNETASRFGAVNVDGTANMLLFALAANQCGGIERFVHVSTAYVAGRREGEILESELEDTGFNSLYEQSKFGAEQLVRDVADRLPISIVRPAQIVGDSTTGFAATFNTLYYPLKLYLKGELPVVPVSSDMKLNMVPVDYVARLVVGALCEPAAAGKTFHAVIPPRLQPTVAELLESVRAWARRELGFDPGKPLCVPVAQAAEWGRRRNLAASDTAKRKSLVQNMLALAPYFQENRVYRTDNVQAVFGSDYPRWQEYLPHLLEYACRKGFLNHTGRTVFEQMLVRMSSRRTRIDYYDVSRAGIVQTPTSEVKRQIECAAAALVARGIRPGDRVALVGFNSTRYFIADAAIGLAGATSVPIYYTSPAADVVSLVNRSGAKLAFVGMERLLQALPGQLDVPIVSLLDAPPVASSVSPWESFLATASAGAPLPAVPFDQVATIRYTSGTTGEPKGVTFTHAQLRWMAEVMPALLDWRTRNGKLRYLSFLPMSHVVEGILVAYAPYYILSDIEMYFLNDFGMLAEALPRIRPALFFSVPRFYEKVWNEFEATDAGKRFLAMPDGPLKKAYAQVARRVLLRKAGLDQCRQLLVGSAPVSMELLQNFRSLGVEIHNAYGVTEAPLIALSRLGENELGSVGRLLPETSAVIDGDGEIHVAGPQVTAGYDGQGGCLDDAGYFATGDFGSWSEAGNLVIGGRKKELIVTSYGKNISPEKVETLLKDVSGVSEALLVGEGRPYVAALLWLEDDARATFDAEALDVAVRERNALLSHPEQVKRWAVMDGALSIAAGELTPNLKLRRANVTQLNDATIEAIYSDDPASAPHALHVGVAR